MGVRTFDRFELTVEVLEDVDPREDGAEEELRSGSGRRAAETHDKVSSKDMIDD